ncbi:hypothetical protein IFU30_12410 [Plantibacter sp. CFBP 8798]|uniref:hypothetical protein n=1 Tax=Plantibacter sp. CFBP 8798 TaxID=2775268 RepID=UPI00177ECD3B|nr:hypothetical protein [Plantibacter sp. CFBP 8798]MBD8467072.1 hypothetical protein [Plantibacter sp. CFBP 8798]
MSDAYMTGTAHVGSGFFSSRGLEPLRTEELRRAIAALETELNRIAESDDEPVSISSLVIDAHRAFVNEYSDVAYRLRVETPLAELYVADPWIGAPIYLGDNGGRFVASLNANGAMREAPCVDANPGYTEALSRRGYSTRSERSVRGLRVLRPGEALMLLRPTDGGWLTCVPVDLPWAAALQVPLINTPADLARELALRATGGVFDRSRHSILVGGMDSLMLLDSMEQSSAVRSQYQEGQAVHFTGIANSEESEAFRTHARAPEGWLIAEHALPSLVCDATFEELADCYKDASGLEIGVAFASASTQFGGGVASVGTGADALLTNLPDVAAKDEYSGDASEPSGFYADYVDASFDLDILPLWIAAEIAQVAIRFPYYGLFPASLVSTDSERPVGTDKESVRRALGYPKVPPTGLPHAMRGIIISKKTWELARSA